MTQLEAVAAVAEHIAGQLQTGEFDFTGRDSQLTEADRDRIGRAVEIVANRLYRMGPQRRGGS